MGEAMNSGSVNRQTGGANGIEISMGIEIDGATVGAGFAIGADFNWHLQDSPAPEASCWLTGCSSQHETGLALVLACIEHVEPHISVEQKSEAKAPPEVPTAITIARNTLFNIDAAEVRLTSIIVTLTTSSRFHSPGVVPSGGDISNVVDFGDASINIQMKCRSDPLRS